MVGHTDESGVTLPPLHPRCRCAIMYREVAAPKSPKLRGTSTLVQPNENAIVYDNGNRNGYSINFDLMNTKAYHDRFENLSKRKLVNEALYKQAIKILGHRNGMEYEDLVIIDARTGDMLVENTSAAGTRTFRCGLTSEQEKYLEKLNKKFEGLHNHPNNSFPSPEDIEALFVRELQVGSNVVCHNGTIYRLEKLKPFEQIKDFTGAIKRELEVKFLGYKENLLKTKISKEIIAQLERKGILKFKEVP